jgi:hypothetical protein
MTYAPLCSILVALLLPVMVRAQASMNPNNYLLTPNHKALNPDALRVYGHAEEYPDSIAVSIIGVGGASAVQSLNQENAGVSFGMALKWGKHEQIRTKKVDNIQTADTTYKLYQSNLFYFLFNPVPANSNDSDNISKTFLFPELSKKDFTVGFEKIFPLVRPRDMTLNTTGFRNTTISCFTELSTSHYDTGENYFRTWCAMAGAKLSFQGMISGLNFGFQVIPYYSLISVEQKYFNALNLDLISKGTAELDTLPHKGIPPATHSVGLNFKASISSFEIFANIKYVLNDKINYNPNITDPDLKNTVITVGLLINPSIWNFNIRHN